MSFSPISIKHIWIAMLFLSTSFSFDPVTAQVDSLLASKREAIENFREYFSKHAYRGHQLTKKKTEKITSTISEFLLRDDGKFKDLVELQQEIENSELYLSKNKAEQVRVGEFLEIAFNRIWRIAQTFRGKSYDEYKDSEVIQKLFKAINNYSRLEDLRGSNTTGRFHISCFAIPTAAVNTYFCLYDAMEHIEKGQEKGGIALQVSENLKKMSYQSWTQPYRKDETDKNPVSVERFRKHVWWVGGNGLGFRSLLPTAAAMRSVEMMDVLAEVAKGGLSSVSQNTWEEAFWTEGFTADGAGWGHGMQNLIWGYPISGASAALNLIEYFKGTPWAQQLGEENAQALINYFRGSSWHYYKGYTPRALGRGSMEYANAEKKEGIKTKQMINTTIDSWLGSYTENEQRELKDLKQDIRDKEINMENYPGGYYNGTRWFFNNDNLIKKNQDYYLFLSMASIRCDGIEMAHNLADRYNFFTCDGLTYFMKEGNEYHKAIGAWHLTALPGVTARQGEDKLVPITNWRGYCSKHNFAAAATRGGENAVSGFIFEKMNASEKKNVNDRAGLNDPNQIIYEVKAHKAYFMVEDYMIALGAGITNLNTALEGDIWTTIDQTHYNGEATYLMNGREVKTSGNLSIQLNGGNTVWASQKDGFSYAVLPEYTTGEVMLTTETRKTKWNKINKQNEKKKNLPTEESIFQLHINHGQHVENGQYAYLVYAGKESPKKAFYDLPMRVLENSTDIQAVSWGDHYIGASFYNPDKVLKIEGAEISVSAPCALLLEKNKDKWHLTVTDAEMNKDLKSIQVRTTLDIPNDQSEKDGKWNVIEVPMFQGKLCGKPATVQLSMK